MEVSFLWKQFEFDLVPVIGVKLFLLKVVTEEGVDYESAFLIFVTQDSSRWLIDNQSWRRNKKLVRPPIHLLRCSTKALFEDNVCRGGCLFDFLSHNNARKSLHPIHYWFRCRPSTEGVVHKGCVSTTSIPIAYLLLLLLLLHIILLFNL